MGLFLFICSLEQRVSSLWEIFAYLFGMFSFDQENYWMECDNQKWHFFNFHQLKSAPTTIMISTKSEQLKWRCANICDGTSFINWLDDTLLLSPLSMDNSIDWVFITSIFYWIAIYLVCYMHPFERHLLERKRERVGKM